MNVRSMKIVATVEARMTSSRLPGKVLLEAGGTPMLQHLISRLRAVPSLSEIVLATTTNVTDDILAAFALQSGITFYRGDEIDVMGRVLAAGSYVHADVIVEITGDCPIIDPDIVEQTIQMFLHHQVDYVSNNLIRSFPDGMDVQVFRLDTLRQSAAMTTDPLDREHVTRHIRTHPEIFSRIHLVAPPSLHWPDLGLTLDEINDYVMLKKIIEALYVETPLFSCLDVLCLLRENPNWLEINQAVVRRGDT
jgi:spore coat polysaccharide biosynthesis protein SpsF